MKKSDCLLTIWLGIIAGAIGLLFTLFVEITPVSAHPQTEQVRYVLATGHDQGDCQNPAQPCRTILYALQQAEKGDEIRVAVGAYQVPFNQIDTLFSAVVLIRGGYNPLDYFTIQDPARNPTYLFSTAYEQRAALADYGFYLVHDAKGWKLAGPEQKSTESINQSPTQFTACTNHAAGPYACKNVDFLANVALDQLSTNPQDANDIWGFVDLNDNREYAIIGLRNGTAVVDVTHPATPVEVGTIPGISAIWRDIKVYQRYNASDARWEAYAYVTADLVSQGLQIIDLTDLPTSISLANTYTGFNRAHNVYLSHVDYTTGVTITGETAYAYILGSELDQGAFRILDLQNPTAPIEVTAPPENTQYVHDATTLVITDSRTVDCNFGHNPCELFIDFNERTVDIWDVTDKDAPHQISVTPYDGAAYTHSGWWSADKQFIFVQDESDERVSQINTTLYTLDISNLKAPFVSGTWTGPTAAIDHNGFTKGNRYYMSNYERGLTVLDISDPNNVAEVGYFDTYPGQDSANFHGAWGVYPYLPSGTILVSDIERGLFLLKLNETDTGETNQTPTVQISLAASSASAGIGQTITYTYAVTNTAAFTIHIESDDSRFGPVPFVKPGGSTFLPPITLSPQERVTASLSDTVTTLHPIGPLVNTFTVTATQIGEPFTPTIVSTATIVLILPPIKTYLPILHR